MKKKILALLLCAASLLALAACGRANAETAEATPEPTAEPVIEAIAAEPDITPEPEPTEEPAASEEPMLTELDLRAYVELFDIFTAVEEDIDEDAVSAKDESIASTPLVDNDRVVRSVTVDLSGVDYTKTGEYDAVYTIVIDRDAYDIAEAERMAEASGEPAEAINENDDAELVEDEPAAEETADDITDDADADADAEPEALPKEFNAEETIVIKHVTILTEDEFNELAEQEGYTLNENGLLVKANPTDEDMAAEALAELGVDVNDENVTLETSVNDEGQTVVKAVVTDEDGNKTTTEAVVDNRTGNVNVTDNSGNTNTIPVATPKPYVPPYEETVGNVREVTPTPAPVTPTPTILEPVVTAAPALAATATPAPAATTTPKPTATTTPKPTATATPKPAATPKPTATPVPTTPTPAPTATPHTHTWTPVYGTRESTIYTTEQQITGYTDGDPIYGTQDVWVGLWNVCNDCGQKFATVNEWIDHNDTCGSYHCIDRYETQTVITGYEQVPVYSEVQVPHTFTEECIEYYECSCGATKPNE